MASCLISLGTNLGQRREWITMAANHLCQSFGPRNIRFSSVVQTPPIGGPAGQDFFLNAVASIEVQEDVYSVWSKLRRIENHLGRTRNQRWEARRIDLDVVLYDNLRIWSPRFKLPHPRMCSRSFVLEPACEIVPDWVDPVTQESLTKLNERRVRSPVRLAVFAETISIYRELRTALTKQLESTSEEVLWKESPPALEKKSFPKAETICLADDGTILLDLISLNSDASSPGSQRSRTGPIATQVLEAVGQWVRWNPVHLLVIAAQSTSDPSVCWEDSTIAWADALGLTIGSEEPSRLPPIPRYLLASNDSIWAAHEIQAAIEGMTCPLEKCEWSLGG